MALHRHTKHIINLYILSIVLIVIGIGIIVGGIFGGMSLRNTIKRLGRELAVLEIKDRDDWGDIPGRRERNLRHQFQVFNVTNPKEIIYGKVPISTMFGPWTFEEERDTENIDVGTATDEFGYEGELFTYTDEVLFFLSGKPSGSSENFSETFSVYNYETFTMQYSHRAEEDWMRAIRALSGMINYTSTQFRDTLIINQLQKTVFKNNYSTKEIFIKKRLSSFKNFPRITESTIESLWTDEIFGFSNFQNAKFWGEI